MHLYIILLINFISYLKKLNPSNSLWLSVPHTNFLNFGGMTADRNPNYCSAPKCEKTFLQCCCSC